MMFTTEFQLTAGKSLVVDVSVSETLFIVGANGSGKTSLLLKFVKVGGDKVVRLSAGRQTWLESSSPEFVPAQKTLHDQHKHGWLQSPESRYKEINAPMRSMITLYDLINSENIDARAIAVAVRAKDCEKIKAFGDTKAPIARMNEILASCNLQIVISVEEGGKLVASKLGGPTYGISELSDGERNALLVSADVLTAQAGSLIIIDEPERHLHRSIVSPLLTQLIKSRADCAFIVATHDLTLPIDNPKARSLLVRSCLYVGKAVQSWDINLVPADMEIDALLKQDILGSRRRIVFVEGTDTSMDQLLYSVLFPSVSFCPKGSARDVHLAVQGIRASQATHWVEAFGIIDEDGHEPDAVSELRQGGIFAISFYSVESIYYHPDVIQAVALGLQNDGVEKARLALNAAIKTTIPEFPRLAARAVEKRLRRELFSYLPTIKSIRAGQPIEVKIETAAKLDEEVLSLDLAASKNDWVYLLTRCPVRETPALHNIAQAIGLRGRPQYESAVLELLRKDAVLLALVRGLFGTLPSLLGVD